MSSLEDIKFVSKSQIDVKGTFIFMNLTGCAILQNGDVLIADFYGKKQLMQYSRYGSRVKDIPLSSEPFDFTFIDSDLVAITYGNKCYAEIFNLTYHTVEKTIPTKGRCWGISHQDGKLWIIVGNRGIILLNVFQS